MEWRTHSRKFKAKGQSAVADGQQMGCIPNDILSDSNGLPIRIALTELQGSDDYDGIGVLVEHVPAAKQLADKG